MKKWWVEEDPRCVMQDSRSSKSSGQWWVWAGGFCSPGEVRGLWIYSILWNIILFLKLVSDIPFCMVFMYMEALLTFCHVALTLYTGIYGTHSLQMTVQRCEGKGHINSSHMSERRCSDKNVLFAMRFKTCAAKTTSVFR